MTDPKRRNFGHSVYTRLLSHARSRRLDFTFVLQRYGMERLLYRMSISSHASRFVLKGASLFLVWKGQSYRVTKDADFLGYDFRGEQELAVVFQEICHIEGCKEDGLVLNAASVRARPIREDQEYGGIRVTLTATLHNARIPLQVDVGYGDIVTPPPEAVTYPTLLDFPAPHLRAYTRYSMVAEKLNAMVDLGPTNSRLKDFYDVWLMSTLFEFDFGTLGRAVHDTFQRRKTRILQSKPFAFTPDFSRDVHKQTQWRAFLRKSRPEHTVEDFSVIVARIEEFLMPVLASVRTGTAAQLVWSDGGPWRPKH